MVDPKSGTRLLINPRPNVRAEALDELTVTRTDVLAPTDDAAVVLLDASRKVISVTSGAAFTLAGLSPPREVPLLVGEGQAGTFLRRATSPRQVLNFRRHPVRADPAAHQECRYGSTRTTRRSNSGCWR